MRGLRLQALPCCLFAKYEDSLYVDTQQRLFVQRLPRSFKHKLTWGGTGVGVALLDFVHIAVHSSYLYSYSTTYVCKQGFIRHLTNVLLDRYRDGSGGEDSTYVVCITYIACTLQVTV